MTKVRLVNSRFIGEGVHRSGWPYAMSFVQSIAHPRNYDLLFDDFIEQHFKYNPMRRPYTEPWVGVWHSPARVPAWMDDYTAWILKSKLWQESRPTLKRLIALSSDLAEFLREKTGVPVDVIKHPTGLDVAEWNYRVYEHEPKNLIQIGSCLRNTEIIRQIPPVEDWSYYRVSANHLDWVKTWETCVKRVWTVDRSRRAYDVVELGRIDDGMYDDALSRSVVVMEYFAAAASNAIVECIARNTPVIVNRLPAIEEYLGPEYPLYFKYPEEIPDMLKDVRIYEAHSYLSEMDKSWITGEAFLDSVKRTVDKAVSGEV